MQYFNTTMHQLSEAIARHQTKNALHLLSKLSKTMAEVSGAVPLRQCAAARQGRSMVQHSAIQVSVDSASCRIGGEVCYRGYFHS